MSIIREILYCTHEYPYDVVKLVVAGLIDHLVTNTVIPPGANEIHVIDALSMCAYKPRGPEYNLLIRNTTTAFVVREDITTLTSRLMCETSGRDGYEIIIFGQE